MENLKAADLGAGANLNGAIPFPASNAWNTDISTEPVDTNSGVLISSIGLGTGLHPDFGAGLYSGAPIGIPYVVVSGSQPKLNILFVSYADESDPVRIPFRWTRLSKARRLTAQPSGAIAMCSL